MSDVYIAARALAPPPLSFISRPNFSSSHHGSCLLYTAGYLLLGKARKTTKFNAYTFSPLYA
jgi:hypothetical protein